VSKVDPRVEPARTTRRFGIPWHIVADQRNGSRDTCARLPGSDGEPVSIVEQSIHIPVLDVKLRAEVIVPDEACGLVAMTHASRSDLSSRRWLR
jgi:hypothetical protein